MDVSNERPLPTPRPRQTRGPHRGPNSVERGYSSSDAEEETVADCLDKTRSSRGHRDESRSNTSSAAVREGAARSRWTPQDEILDTSVIGGKKTGILNII